MPRAGEPVLRVPSDPLRRQIVGLLATEQLCTCHLVELTSARQTNISNHLRVLREVGLVAAEPASRFTCYRLAARAARCSARATDRPRRMAQNAATRHRPCP